MIPQEKKEAILDAYKVASKEATKKLGEDYDFPENAEKSEHRLKIIKAIRGFGTYQDQVRKLVKIMMPELEISDESDDIIEINDHVGAIIIPLDNPNDHTYDLGVPYMITGRGRYLVDTTGNTGNCMSRQVSSMMLATEEQIDEFWDEVMENGTLYIIMSSVVDL